MKCKKIRWLTIILLTSIFVLFNGVVNAEETFDDVEKDYLYYDSIMELVNEGVLSGYDDGAFRPDKKISICEAIIIIEKVFGNEDNLPEWGKWQELTDTGTIYQTDWEVPYTIFFNKYYGAVTWEIGSNFILAATKTKKMKTELFGYSSKFLNFSNIKLKGYKTNFNPQDMMSRGEFVDLVVWAKNNINNKSQFSIKFPIRYSFIGYTDLEARQKAETDVLSSFLSTPEWLLNYYRQKNGEIKIVEEDKWDSKYEDYDGVYENIDGRPVISVRYTTNSIALHELGHFVWDFEDLSLPKDIDIADCVVLVSNTPSDYCKTNEKEYFAEMFQAYFLYTNWLKREEPKMYEFIDNICNRLADEYME